MPPFFDPLLAKAIVWRPSRDEAIAGLAQALAETRLYGVETNRQYLSLIHISRQISSVLLLAKGEIFSSFVL